eukprot:COSAG04_NODE_19_length_39217_cov_21.535968_25_plen_227_part_00
MKTSDWGMWTLAAAVISFHLASEIRDIKLCEITIRDRGGKTAWRFLLLFICTVRQFALVPMVAGAATFLVMYDSSNAKDIGLSAVGVIFLLQIDNEAFEFALPDRVRMHVEQFGRAEIGEAEARRLSAGRDWIWPLLWLAMIIIIKATQIRDLGITTSITTAEVISLSSIIFVPVAVGAVREAWAVKEGRCSATAVLIVPAKVLVGIAANSAAMFFVLGIHPGQEF